MTIGNRINQATLLASGLLVLGIGLSMPNPGPVMPISAFKPKMDEAVLTTRTNLADVALGYGGYKMLLILLGMGMAGIPSAALTTAIRRRGLRGLIPETQAQQGVQRPVGALPPSSAEPLRIPLNLGNQGQPVPVQSVPQVNTAPVPAQMAVNPPQGSTQGVATLLQDGGVSGPISGLSGGVPADLVNEPVENNPFSQAPATPKPARAKAPDYSSLLKHTLDELGRTAGVTNNTQATEAGLHAQNKRLLAFAQKLNGLPFEVRRQLLDQSLKATPFKYLLRTSGLLLYGEPGSNKTSLASAIAMLREIILHGTKNQIRRTLVYDPHGLKNRYRGGDVVKLNKAWYADHWAYQGWDGDGERYDQVKTGIIEMLERLAASSGAMHITSIWDELSGYKENLKPMFRKASGQVDEAAYRDLVQRWAKSHGMKTRTACEYPIVLAHGLTNELLGGIQGLQDYIQAAWVRVHVGSYKDNEGQEVPTMRATIYGLSETLHQAGEVPADGNTEGVEVAIPFWLSPKFLAVAFRDFFIERKAEADRTSPDTIAAQTWQAATEAMGDTPGELPPLELAPARGSKGAPGGTDYPKPNGEPNDQAPRPVDRSVVRTDFSELTISGVLADYFPGKTAKDIGVVLKDCILQGVSRSNCIKDHLGFRGDRYQIGRHFVDLIMAELSWEVFEQWRPMTLKDIQNKRN